VTLENEYVRVLVLPEIGGACTGRGTRRTATRGCTGSPRSKPGLISMTGAWISGGIEWNFPHGHRPSGFMPVDHRVVKNADGSATVWSAETEPVYRMRWVIGLTLFPGRSYCAATTSSSTPRTTATRSSSGARAPRTPTSGRRRSTRATW